MNKADKWTGVVLLTDDTRLPDGRLSYLGRVAGLSVLARIIKTLAHEGASKIALVTRFDSDELINEAKSACPESTSMYIAKQPENLQETDMLKAAVASDFGNLVVAYADLSFSRNLLQALLHEDKTGLDAYVAIGRQERWTKEDLHEPLGVEADTRFSGLAWTTSDLIGALPSDCTLARGLMQLMSVRRIEFRRMEYSHALRVKNKNDLQRAEKLQIQSLRRNTDGLISQYLNRPISLRLCRFVFLPLGFKPNHITLLAALVGWVGIGLVVSWSGYFWVLLGSLLFHISSILDGCDGEIARLKFQFSRFGEWLDNVLDEINNTAFIACIGLGAFFKGGSEILAWASGFYCLAIVVCDSAAFYQLAKWRGGTGNVEKFRWFFEKESKETPTNPTAYPKRQGISDWLKELPRRDFYIFLFLLLAAADMLLAGFWLAVILGVVLFILGILQWTHQLTSRPSVH